MARVVRRLVGVEDLAGQDARAKDERRGRRDPDDARRQPAVNTGRMNHGVTLARGR